MLPPEAALPLCLRALVVLVSSAGTHRDRDAAPPSRVTVIRSRARLAAAASPNCAIVLLESELVSPGHAAIEKLGTIACSRCSIRDVVAGEQIA